MTPLFDRRTAVMSSNGSKSHSTLRRQVAQRSRLFQFQMEIGAPLFNVLQLIMAYILCNEAGNKFGEKL
jgi:hypothetical protein